MKRTRMIGLLIVAALMLGMSGLVSAQEPQFFSNLTSNMNPVYPGNTPEFTLQGTMDFDTNGGGSGFSCLAITLPISGTAWSSVATLSATANGDDITGSMGSWTTDGTGSGADCHSVGSIAAAPTDTQWWYVRMPSDGKTAQSVVVTVRATVNGNSGSYTIRAAMNDSAFAAIGTWFYIDMTGNPMVQNAAATTRYVANNTPQCLGNTPCDTGTSGLQVAIDALTAAPSTVVILGQYQISSGTTVDVDNNEDITIRGQGGASLLSASGACSGYMLDLSNSTYDVTIQDLTLDGDMNCTSGNRNGINIGAGSGTITLQDLTIRDMTTGVAGAVPFTNDSVTYDSNTMGASVTGGAATFDSDTFTDNTTGLAVSASGAVTVTNSSFDGNTTGVSHTAGTASVGTSPGDGNTLTDNTTGILSNGGTIKDNTITGGTTGISMTATSITVYGNSVTGASGNEIECTGGGFAAAGFNYIGGNYAGGGTNCSDSMDQLGSEIAAWTDGASLNECTVSGSGPIFDLGNASPFGLAPPQGRNSNYYATTSVAGTVTITVSGGTTQFKMHMDRTDNGAGGSDVCNPMDPECWEDSTSRAQTNAGYYFYGSQDPTVLTLANVTAESPNLWLPVGMAVVILAGVVGALLLMRRKRA